MHSQRQPWVAPIKSKLVLLFVVLAVWFCHGAGNAADLTHAQVLEHWGWIIARDQGLAGVEIQPDEFPFLLSGFSNALQQLPAPEDLNRIYPEVERMAKARREKLVQAMAQKNEAAARIFFDDLKRRTNTFALPGGACCEILEPGRGTSPRLEQTVNVHYTAHLIDGTEFSQMGPLDHVLVTNRSICRGWVESLQKIRPGGAVRLYIPPPLPEAEAFRWGIEPGSAMIFDIELLDVKATTPADLENALLPPAPEPEPPPPAGYSDKQILETWGWTIARQTGADHFGLSAVEISALSRGLATGIRGGLSPADLSAASPAVRQFITESREKIRRAAQQKRLDEMNGLFATLKQNTNVLELPDGLRYEILKAGHGPFPGSNQIVEVDYTARLVDGTVFDKTYNEPLHVQVGSVIAGWNEGIQKINQGGRIRLYIPPALGYGDEDRSGVVAPIPADSTLIYEIELLGIQEAPKDESARTLEQK